MLSFEKHYLKKEAIGLFCFFRMSAVNEFSYLSLLMSKMGVHLSRSQISVCEGKYEN
jgi:hypothetical protein